MNAPLFRGIGDGKAVVRGTWGAAAVNGLEPQRGDIVVEKPGLAMGPVNPIIMGEPTVMIGEVGMGSPVVVTPDPPLVLLGQAMSGASASGQTQAEVSKYNPSNAAVALATAAQVGTPFIHPCPG